MSKLVTEDMKKYISSLTREDLEAMLLRVLTEQLKFAVKLSVELAKMGAIIKKGE